MYNIVLFDDHSFVTDAMVLYFKDKSDVNVLAAYQDSFAFLEGIAKLKDVNIVISDVLTDEELGLTIFETLYKNYPEISTIVFSSIKSDFLIKNLKDLGVAEVISKKDGFDAIYDCIKRIEHIKSKASTEEKIYPSLTNKEKVIVDHLIKGIQAKEIAMLTNTSFHTINNQKNTLLEKYECNNTTELIVKLMRLGLISIT